MAPINRLSFVCHFIGHPSSSAFRRGTRDLFCMCWGKRCSFLFATIAIGLCFFDEKIFKFNGCRCFQFTRPNLVAVDMIAPEPETIVKRCQAVKRNVRITSKNLTML